MKTTTLYRINTDRFAHETVDDEVIVIDMDEGNYFSMRGSAAAVWQLVDQGFPGTARTHAMIGSARHRKSNR